MLDDERRQVAAAARRLAADGLVHGTNGNVSARAGGHVAITPTGAVLGELTADDVCVVDLGGDVVAGGLAPTSEADMHLGIYERFDAGAVVHTHAPVATALSCVLDDELPACTTRCCSWAGRCASRPTPSSARPSSPRRSSRRWRAALSHCWRTMEPSPTAPTWRGRCGPPSCWSGRRRCTGAPRASARRACSTRPTARPS